MNVLMISLDTTLMTQKIGNTRHRHDAYAERAGHIAMVVCNRRGSAPALPVYHSASGRVVAQPTNSRGYYQYLLDGYRIGMRFHRERPIDMITTQDPFLTGVIGLALRRTTGAPVLMQINSPTVDNAFFAAESRRNAMLQKLARWTLPQADGVRVLSEAERQACIHHGVAAERVCIVPIPPHVDRFMSPVTSDQIALWRERLQLSSETPTALWVGRPVNFKNLPLLLRSFQKVRERVPAARLVLAGDMTGTTIPQQIAELGLTGIVELPGAVTHDDLPVLYQLASVYVHPSIYEGLGVVMLEASAAGLPIVATASDGAQEIVVDQETGVLVPLNDEPAFTAALISLLSDPERARAMGAQGKMRVQTTFNENALIDRWVEMWRRVAAKEQPCGS